MCVCLFICCSHLILSKQNIIYGIYITVMGMFGTCFMVLLLKLCGKKCTCLDLYKKWKKKKRRDRRNQQGDSLSDDSVSIIEMNEYLEVSTPAPLQPFTDPKEFNQGVLGAAFQHWAREQRNIKRKENQPKQLNSRERENLRLKKSSIHQLGEDLRKFKDGMDQAEDQNLNFFPTVEEHRQAAAVQPEEDSSPSESHYREIWWASLHEYANQAKELYQMEMECEESNEGWEALIAKRQEHFNLAQQICHYTGLHLPEKKQWVMKTFFYTPPHVSHADHRTKLDAFLVQEREEEEEVQLRKQQKKKRTVRQEEPMDQEGGSSTDVMECEESASPCPQPPPPPPPLAISKGKRKATASHVMGLRKEAQEVTERLSKVKKVKKCRTEEQRQAQSQHKKGQK